MRFSVLRFWLFFNFSIFLDRLFGFRAKRRRIFGFDVHLIIAFCGFFVFQHSAMFSVFVKYTSGFSVLVSDVVFGFSYFALFGLRFNFDLSGNSSRIAAKKTNVIERNA